MPWMLPAFLALLSLCAFYTGLPRVRGGMAPLMAVATVMVFFTLAGVAGLLLPAAWVFCLLCLALGGLALWRGRGALLRRLWCPGFALFAGAGLALLVLLAVRQPPFSHWDEFSFWGTAAKLVKQQGVLYPVADMGWPWTATQSPGLVLLGWFVQAFAPDFMPWAVYWGYGLLIFACAAALLAPFGWRQWRVVLPLAVAGLLLPFVFTVYYHTTQLAPAYLSAYADVPAGLLAGGALALYFGAIAEGWLGRGAAKQPEPTASQRAPRRLSDGPGGAAVGGAIAEGWLGRAALWPAALALAALALVKDNVLAVALVAAGIIAADMILFGGRRAPAGPPQGAPVAGAAVAGRAAPPGPARRLAAALRRPGSLPRRLAGALGMLAAPLLASRVWGAYTGLLVSQRAGTSAGESNISPFSALFQALGQLFSPAAQRSERFTAVAASMWDRFMGRVVVDGQVLDERFNVSMLGSAAATCAVILLLFVLAAALAGSRRGALRVALAGGLCSAGFVAYNLTLLAYYAFMNKSGATAYAAPDYERYLACYLPAALMLALVLLGAVAEGWLGRAAAKQPEPAAGEGRPGGGAPEPLRAAGGAAGEGWLGRAAGAAVAGGPPGKARAGLARVALWAFCALLALRFAVLVRPGYSVLDYPPRAYAAQRAEQARVAALAEEIRPGERVFFVCQGGNGEEWLHTSYYLLPTVLEYSLSGGGSLAPPPEGLKDYDTREYQSLEDVRAYLADKDIALIWIDRLDEAFIENYGALFGDGLAGYSGQGPALYRLGEGGLYWPVVS